MEFAIVVVPLLLLLFGAIESGRLLWTRQALQETAITAARCIGIKQASCAPSGSYDSTTTSTYVQTIAAQWSVAIPAAGITLNANTSCSGVANFAQVTLAYTFQTAVPGLLGSFSGGVPVSATACFPNQS